MQLGPYRLVKLLGSGGMGTVWQATHLRLEKTVALKLLSPQLVSNDELVARFEREMKAVGRLDHPHLVRAYDAGDEQGVHYLAIEFIDGPDLTRLVREQGPLSVERAVELIRQAAVGLAAAHRSGLIHRDIKPANMMLADDGQLKITDLGLARLQAELASQETGDTLTLRGQILGTPDYMAPEQWDDTHAVDGRCDLYALGCTLFFLLVGKPPYATTGHTTLISKRNAHFGAPIPDLRALAPHVPVTVAQVYERLMAKAPADRFASASELAETLDELLRGLERPDSSGEANLVLKRPQDASGELDQTLNQGATSIHGTLPEIRSTPSTRRIDRPQTGLNNALRRFLAAGTAALLLLSGFWYFRPEKTSSPETSARQEIAAASTSATMLSASQTPASGWHGWPADAPQPAIAPFDAAQAKQHQEEWAAYLKVPVEYTNSIGMKFRLIPPGEFLMGSTPGVIEAALRDVDDESWKNRIKSEGPQHKVILTQPLYVGVTEVTQSQYEQVMGTNPSHFSATGDGRDLVANLETGNHPVEMVNWNNAAEFCSKLSQQEKLKPFYLRAGETITPLDGTGYRLPTEAEWEYSCRAGTTTRFWSGDADQDLDQAGWFSGNSGGRTHAAGELKANPFGLHDIHGNVWEMVQDGWDAAFYGKLQEGDAVNPFAPYPTGSYRVDRGGSRGSVPAYCRSAIRSTPDPTYRTSGIGFRLALPVHAVRQSVSNAASERTATTTPDAVSWHGWPADAPAPAIAPFDADQAKRHQEAWAAYLKVPVEYTNSIGMKFRLIPPGEFLMGSTPAEIAAALKDAGKDEHWQACIKSEAPQHKVILTQPIYLGMNEVTQAEYEKVLGVNPSHFAPSGMGKEVVAGMEIADHPVEMVSWNDAAEFCAKLSQQEKLKPFYFRAGETITPLDGTGYRLPSEAEWEFACRAGTTTKYWIGDKDEDLERAGWSGTNSGGRTHAAGELKSNPFGLHDIHGNVWEWVQDGWDASYYGQFPEKIAVNPGSPFSAGSWRVLRGGNSLHPASYCRSSLRNANVPTHRYRYFGFRVSLPVDAVRQSVNAAAAASGSTTKLDALSWQGWPADAPAPAIAPFDADQAQRHQEAWAAYLKAPVEYTNSIGMKLVLIPAGEYTRGTPDGDNYSHNDEKPAHKVRITQSFFLGQHEVTQGEWKAVMGTEPWMGQAYVKEGKDYPATYVSHDDAVAFCKKLSEKDGKVYRLPTEAEWEYAARGGTTTRFSFGDDESKMKDYAWCDKNAWNIDEKYAHQVGLKKPNNYGLFDMHGNVSEWCADWYHDNEYAFYASKIVEDPQGPPSGATRVHRGGGWGDGGMGLRSAHRGMTTPVSRKSPPGFRVASVLLGR